ncbi:phospholipase C/P1 nuclease [Eremomyces bilateralis CBS 781.70]|uniref:Phospholipase C/P1 nuclease n=1 Tax=Eremomyces bilateralis CBS 781.70 TaxID=1392243 RepID=A0A6G1FQP7_9PEZI|nr:phospholipase C/P1 nuclease [Eremomyces bilateralis CBS 781.70]KAF1808066.1 phospholipase C/P1 nuclease [Eremomyces bilateralis CBS 781.70]
MRSSLVSSLFIFVSSVVAWGDVGHRTVGYLAEKYFSDEGKEFVHSLLANENDWDISDAATWADVIKYHRPYSREWHYIDAKDDPPHHCDLQLLRDCPQDGCIISQIVNQTNLVLDTSNSHTTRREALMYIIHFIGDLHQPLHTERMARGGNGIHTCFDHRCSRENLHGIWDTDIVHKLNGLRHSEKHDTLKDAAAKWGRVLFDQAQGQSAQAEECNDVKEPEHCALAWGQEANGLVCSYVMKPGVEWLEKNDLGGEYFEGAAPIVAAQISRAGTRLGAYVNALAAEIAKGTPAIPVAGKRFDL